MLSCVFKQTNKQTKKVVASRISHLPSHFLGKLTNLGGRINPKHLDTPFMDSPDIFLQWPSSLSSASQCPSVPDPSPMAECLSLCEGSSRKNHQLEPAPFTAPIFPVGGLVICTGTLSAAPLLSASLGTVASSVL